MSDTKEMPLYVSHKEVRALEIKSVERDESFPGYLVHFEDGSYPPMQVNADVLHRYRPARGDFLVKYADGYVSISPRKAFLEGYSQPKAHEGLPVAGYKPQTSESVAIVNVNKELEERVLRQMDTMSDAQRFDQRWLSIGRTAIEQGFMALNRAVFKPGRVKLPDDDQLSQGVARVPLRFQTSTGEAKTNV
jgi:hypothetical protein